MATIGFVEYKEAWQPWSFAMSALIDLTDRRFHRLTALRRAGVDRRGKPLWHCRCDCGVEKELGGDRLRDGRVKSCGCLRSEVTAARNYRHGLTSHPLYWVWVAMKDRCQRSTNHSFKNYGGRGIGVCEEWQGFQTFYTWAIPNGYQLGLTIERVDNDGNYTPENCTWVPKADQSQNQRSNRAVLRSDGQMFKTLTAAADAVGGSWSGLKDACRKGAVYRGFTWRIQLWRA